MASAAAALLLLSSSSPTRAAMGSWDIKGPGNIPGFTASRLAFGASGCSPSAPAAQNTQGLDGVAINVAGWRGRTLHFSWTTQSPMNVGGLSATFLSQSCGTTSGPATSGSGNPGPWNVFVHGDATWLVVETTGAVLVHLDLNAVS